MMILFILSVILCIIGAQMAVERKQQSNSTYRH